MGRRAVIVAGRRTPFARAFAELLHLDAIGLGVAAVRGLLDHTHLAWREIDAVVWGGVVLPGGSPNVGREIVIDTGLPPSIEAMTVSRACASGLQAVTLAAAQIERGEADVVIAGGGDSTSNAEVKMPQSLVHKAAPVVMKRGAGPADYLRLLSRLSPLRDLVPRAPRVVERSTGQLMGEAAEDMAARNLVTRGAQDALALRSHHRAAAAVAAGRFVDELVSVETQRGPLVTHTKVRGDTTLDALAKLRPAFRKDGTLTAGNSSALTDGAAAVLLMEEGKARALGYTPLAAFRSWSYVGVDPADQLLMGPALAMPRALDRAGLKLSDVDVVDVHEAFAAQVLSILQMLASDAFAKERLGRDVAVGEVDPARLNVYGGSIALGHPFAATGARMVTTMARELHARGGGTALLGICAAGGLGAAAVLEGI
jgi:acetyl-CoA acyltransferase